MAGDAAAAAVTGGSAMLPMMVRSFGGGVQEARAKGYGEGQQVLLGLANAATEFFSEKLFGGNPVYDSDVGLVNRLVGKVIKNPKVMEALASAPVEMLNEGLEEIVSDLLNPVAEWAITGNRPEYELDQIIEDGAVGVLTAMIANGGAAVTNRISSVATAQGQKTAPTEGAESITVRSSGKSALDGHGLAKTLAVHIPEISNMQPVTELTGMELNDRTRKPSEQIKDFFATIGSVFRREVGAVSFGEYGIGGMLNHRPLNRAKMLGVVAAPEVIQNGKIISDDPNWKGRGYRSIIFAAPVIIAGTPTYVAAVVNQNPDGKFYMSECVDAEGNYLRIENAPSDNPKSGVTV